MELVSSKWGKENNNSNDEFGRPEKQRNKGNNIKKSYKDENRHCDDTRNTPDEQWRMGSR